MIIKPTLEFFPESDSDIVSAKVSKETCEIEARTYLDYTINYVGYGYSKFFDCSRSSLLYIAKDLYNSFGDKKMGEFFLSMHLLNTFLHE